eukprot:482303-Amphidinium_carterae.1
MFSPSDISYAMQPWAAWDVAVVGGALARHLRSLGPYDCPNYGGLPPHTPSGTTSDTMSK